MRPSKHEDLWEVCLLYADYDMIAMLGTLADPTTGTFRWPTKEAATNAMRRIAEALRNVEEG